MIPSINPLKTTPEEDLKSALLELKSKRGRRSRKQTNQDKIMDERRRMEKNRIFARENRKRKKEYIASLEAQVYYIIINRFCI